MGENKHIEEIHAFTKKYLNEIPTESPSIDFTKNLMGKIAKIQPEKEIVYKPLISKKGWFLVAASIIAIILLPFKNSEEGLFTLPEVNFSFFEKMSFSGIFESVNVSTTTASLLVLFSILFFIQIFYLKGEFERRINS
jgi:hypothetical protein